MNTKQILLALTFFSAVLLSNAATTVPDKPITPSGSISVCTGSSSNYTTNSTNATSYEWHINPGTAGVISNETTKDITITWSSFFSGDAVLTVYGVNDPDKSVVSDPLTVTVKTIPEKPTISGDDFVKIGTSSEYTATSSFVANWTWSINPTTSLATISSANNSATINFKAIGTLKVKLQTSNSCGTSAASDDYSIEIFDPEVVTSLNNQVVSLTTLNQGLNQEISTLTSENDNLKTQVDALTITNNEFQKQIDDLTTQNSDLQAQVDELATISKDLQTQVDDLTVTVDDLMLQVEILTFLNDDLQTKVEALSKVYVLQWSVDNVSTQVFQTIVGNFSISLYPNPSPGEVFVECSELIKEIKVLNLQGQVLISKTVNNNKTSFIVSRETMPVGTYLARIVTSKGVATHKFIIIP